MNILVIIVGLYTIQANAICVDNQIPVFYENGRILCEWCQGGTYSLSGDAVCTECPTGHVRSSYQTSCQLCRDSYIPNSSQELCVPCKYGMYSLPGDAICTGNCNLAKFQNCQLCPNNQIPNSQNNGCEECENEAYSFRGFLQCQPCQLGYIRQSTDQMCVLCRDNYIPNEIQDKCLPCEAGTYSYQRDTSCTPCPNGYIASLGSSCQPCSNNEIPSQHQDFCESCPQGTYSISGEIVCTPCPPGQHRGQEQSSCEFCPNNHIPSQSKTQCNECPGGYNLVGQSCEQCQEGSYSLQGGTICKNCTLGYYRSNSYGQNCRLCEFNYIPNLLKNGCDQCAYGTYSIPGDISCEACPKDQTEQFDDGFTICSCPAGHFFNSDLLYCLICPDSFIRNESHDGCDPCPNGTYNIQGQTTCTICPSGFYRNQEFSSCQLCSKSFIPNQTQDECESCPNGTYSLSGDAICTPCLSGYIRNQDYSTCQLCSDNFIPNQIQSECQPCPLHTYSLSGNVICKSCPSRFYIEYCQCHDSNEDIYVYHSDGSCKKCDISCSYCNGLEDTCVCLSAENKQTFKRAEPNETETDDELNSCQCQDSGTDIYVFQSDGTCNVCDDSCSFCDGTTDTCQCLAMDNKEIYKRGLNNEMDELNSCRCTENNVFQTNRSLACVDRRSLNVCTTEIGCDDCSSVDQIIQLCEKCIADTHAKFRASFGCYCKFGFHYDEKKESCLEGPLSEKELEAALYALQVDDNFDLSKETPASVTKYIQTIISLAGSIDILNTTQRAVVYKATMQALGESTTQEQIKDLATLSFSLKGDKPESMSSNMYQVGLLQHSRHLGYIRALILPAGGSTELELLDGTLINSFSTGTSSSRILLESDSVSYSAINDLVVGETTYRKSTITVPNALGVKYGSIIMSPPKLYVQFEQERQDLISAIIDVSLYDENNNKINITPDSPIVITICTGVKTADGLPTETRYIDGIIAIQLKEVSSTFEVLSNQALQLNDHIATVTFDDQGAFAIVYNRDRLIIEVQKLGAATTGGYLVKLSFSLIIAFLII